MHILYIQTYTVYAQYLQICVHWGGISMNSLLEVKGLCKKLDGFSLENISFELKPGYIMGLIGVNGSGKTTLLHTILNLYQPDSGSVTVSGYPMENQDTEAKARIGAVLEKDFFEEEWTVKKNGRVYGAFYSDFSLSVFLQACSRFEVPPERKVKELSKGTRRKMQFAFALSHNPLLYFMDEPADGLDPGFRRSLLSCMQEIVESGERSVIFSTHLTEDLDKVADYILLIHEGKILFCLDKESLYSRFRLVKGAKEELMALPDKWVVGMEHKAYHSEALISLTEENRSRFGQLPAPKLASIFYYCERGKDSCGN